MRIETLSALLGAGLLGSIHSAPVSSSRNSRESERNFKNKKPFMIYRDFPGALFIAIGKN